MHTIVIADSHNLCREALCHYIRSAGQGMEVTGVGDLQSLHARLSDAKPDVVLIDSLLSGMEDQGQIRELVRRFHDLRFAVMVTQPDESLRANPLLRGIFPKTLSSKAVLAGIQDVLCGKYFQPAMEPEAIRVNTGSAPVRAFRDFGLTMRERDVLSHLVKGASNKEIARAMDLQVVTIKLHVRGICRKLGASNRTQAALIAREHGWG